MTQAILFKGIQIYKDRQFESADVYVKDGIFSDVPENLDQDTLIINGRGLHMFPGFCDLHVHFREPGKEYKETIESGAMAAAHGGYTSVCTMPNLNPVPDSLENLKPQIEKIIEASKKRAIPRVIPYASISRGEHGKELSDMEELAPFVAGFTDDGVGVMDENLMEEAMKKAEKLNKAIVAHAEDIGLVNGGVIHDGEYARIHGHKGNPSASEYEQVRRDLDLAEKTGVHYHVCHVSTKESVAAILEAKEKGLRVSFETGPHYLTLKDMDLQEDGRFKMNPPIRAEEDRDALRKAMCAGSLDAIATDHAPHSEEEKSRGLDRSLNGIVGLETAFSVCYTDLVRTGLVELGDLVYLLSIKPYRTLGLDSVKDPRGVKADPELGLKPGNKANFTVFDLEDRYTIDPKDFLSKGKSSPFTGKEVYGSCLMTVVDGEFAYINKDNLEKRAIG